uniref:Uncharacterized protein n=1 Tax=Acrobeloides nanus TaxID=290746 RepID=A0A914E366_9BILA
MRVPQDRVWVPDIVLFNNADGNYEVSYHSNVVVDHQGNVIWVPPAIYKSSCRIDVEYFPFDEQVCVLIFGSWTYDKNEVKLRWYNNKKSVELEDYSYSGIWDVIKVPGQLVQDQSRMEFRIVIRRKTLFYTVILIIPTVLMAFLSMMVFYLPAECSEKITLGISILLALVVFLLLVSKILPPTSDTIPLMAKYLLLTFVLNIVTIMATVIIINVYFRSATTHSMPECVRKIFLEFLPTLLMMKRPERIPIFNGYFVEEYCASEIFDAKSEAAAAVNHLKNNSIFSGKYTFAPEPNEGSSHLDNAKYSHEQRISQELKATVESIAYIAEHMKAEMSDKKIRDDWKYISMVIDRLLLFIFFGITLGGTTGIIFSAPHVFDFIDQHKIIQRLIAESKLQAANLI